MKKILSTICLLTLLAFSPKQAGSDKPVDPNKPVTVTMTLGQWIVFHRNTERSQWMAGRKGIAADEVNATRDTLDFFLQSIGTQIQKQITDSTTKKK